MRCSSTSMIYWQALKHLRSDACSLKSLVPYPRLQRIYKHSASTLDRALEHSLRSSSVQIRSVVRGDCVPQLSSPVAQHVAQNANMCKHDHPGLWSQHMDGMARLPKSYAIFDISLVYDLGQRWHKHVHTLSPLVDSDLPGSSDTNYVELPMLAMARAIDYWTGQVYIPTCCSRAS